MKLLERTVGWIATHIILILTLIWGIFVWSPFLAPVFMHFGFESIGLKIYWIYRVFCHQLPQRSFFLFGPQLTYELETIQAVFVDTTDMLVLRQFIGSAEMGWKMAWSDRMVSFYGGFWLWTVLWQLLPARMRPNWRWYHPILFAIPMALDGGTHMLSDILYGIGDGFRDHNQWFAQLTQYRLPATFYAGDGFGTMNSLLRLLTGLLCSLGVIGWALPYLQTNTNQK